VISAVLPDTLVSSAMLGRRLEESSRPCRNETSGCVIVDQLVERLPHRGCYTFGT